MSKRMKRWMIQKRQPWPKTKNKWLNYFQNITYLPENITPTFNMIYVFFPNSTYFCVSTYT